MQLGKNLRYEIFKKFFLLGESIIATLCFFQIMLKTREKQLNEIQNEIVDSHSKLKSLKDSLVNKFSVELAQSSLDINFNQPDGIPEVSAIPFLELTSSTINTSANPNE